MRVQKTPSGHKKREVSPDLPQVRRVPVLRGISIITHRAGPFCKYGHQLNSRSCRDRTFWFPSSRCRDSCSRRSNSCPSECCWENCGNALSHRCHYSGCIHSRMTGHKRKPGHQREEKHSPRRPRESYKRTNELLSWQSRVFDS